MKDLETLLGTELRELYDGEHLLMSALQELEKYSQSKLLKMAFAHHTKQTRKHGKRLEAAFKELGQEPLRRACKGLEGIIDEAQTAVEEFMGNSALDAALIAAAQKAEQYEIAAYGSLCTWARELGKEKVASLLEENLSDEKQTDKALTLLAEYSRNPKAKKEDTAKRSQEEAELLKAITHGD